MPPKSSLEHQTDTLWKKYLAKNTISSIELPFSFTNKFWSNYHDLLEQSKEATTLDATVVPKKPNNETLIQEKYKTYWEYNNPVLSGEIKMPQSQPVFTVFKFVMTVITLILILSPDNSIMFYIAFYLLIFSIVCFFGLALFTKAWVSSQCTIMLQENHLIYTLKWQPEDIKIEVPYHQIKKLKPHGYHLKIFVKNREALTYYHASKHKHPILIPLDIENTYHLRRFLNEIIQINRTKN